MSTALPTDDLGALHRYARTGDPRAFEVLVRRYQGMVLATCLRTLPSRADAEDAAQETFLKLAHAASAVRTNVAAWLHGCAVRTSVDLVRKHGSRARAEAGAAEASVAGQAGADGAEPAAWREIRPMLDAAIAALSEDDRALIVERFLAGRPEVELAREARVSPGTMNRRIDRALDRLRVKLVASGLGASGAIAGGVLLTEMLGKTLTAAGPVPVNSAMTTSLMQVGLASMPACGAAAGVGLTGSGVKICVIAAVLGVVSIAGVSTFMVARGGRAAAVASLAGLGGETGDDKAPANSGPFLRPTKAEGPYIMTEFRSDEAKGDSRVACVGRVFRFEFRIGPGKGVGTTFRIDSVEGKVVRGKPLKMRVTMLSNDAPDAGAFGELVGKTLDATLVMRGDLMDLKVESEPDANGGRSMFRVGGRRMKDVAPVVPGASEKDGKDQPPVPEFVGTWGEAPMLQFAMDDENLKLVDGDMEAVRFKILEWDDSPGNGVAKVHALCARNMLKPQMIGQRVWVLFRRDAEGYTWALYDTESKKFGQVPSGFDAEPGQSLVVFACGKEKP